MPSYREQAAAAQRHHQAGALDEAERLYRAVLSVRPDHADSLYGMGLLARAGGRNDVAVAFIGRAVKARPDAAHYHVDLGLALLALGHAEPARAAIRVAVLRDPDDPRARVGLALALESLDRIADATIEADTALRLSHGSAPGARLLLARLQDAAGKAEQATATLRLLVRDTPDDAAAWHQLGTIHARLGHPDEAEAALRHVVRLHPADPAALANLGGLLFERGRHEAALSVLRQAAALGNPTAATRSNLALVLMALGELEPAERELALAAAQAPAEDGILVNRASILTELGRAAEAEACLETVLQRTPATSMDHARARFNRATLRLGAGSLQTGWEDYEARRRLLASPRHALPDWDGTPLPDAAAVLLHAEQGLGDAIQFLRYVPLAARHTRIVLAMPPALLRLAHDLASDRCRVIADDAPPPPDCVAQAGLLSLPHLLRHPAIPAFSPYLQPPDVDRRRWRTWVDTLPGLRVGLSWAGNPDYRFDRRRSIPPELLAPLGRIPGVTLVSLQRDANPPAAILQPPAPLTDLADTAALIASLDLIVSVDTAIAHLAGSLGQPVWLLNRFGGDWRWQAGLLDPNGNSLLYPSLRQFRPSAPDQDWRQSIGELAGCLSKQGQGSALNPFKAKP